MKFILSLMMLIAGIFSAPDTFVVSAISAPVMAFEYKLVTHATVTPLVNRLSHLNFYIMTKSDKTLDKETIILASHFREVETVPKFPNLIRQNSLKTNQIVTVGLVS